MHPTETPSTPGTPDRRRIAQQRLAARARRVTMLRRRVVAGALATFVLAWGVVSQTGSLGQHTTTTAAATPVSTATPVSAVSDPAPVTTSQS
jgi:hypothetical protein